MITNSKMEFVCPYCGAYYMEFNGEYRKKINKNKTGVTRISCKCGKKFYLTFFAYDMKCHFVAYKGEKK